MPQKIYVPFTATAAVSVLTLTQDADAQNVGQNIQILAIDMTLVNATINLPSLTSVFFGTTPTGGGVGVGATAYKIQGSIVAGAFPRVLTFNAFNTGGDTDTICGSASVTITGVGASFIAYIGGRHTWGIEVCNTGNIS